MRVLFLESVSGIAGDMFAASFIHAGLLDPEQAQDVPRQLGLEGARVVISPVHRSEVAAIHVDVTVEGRGEGGDRRGAHDHHHEDDHHLDHSHTHYRELDALLEKSELVEAAKAFARRVFRILAEAEAQAHGCEPEEVSFHEVGDVDSIIDVALAGLCVAAVGAHRVFASPIRLGRGTIATRHGRYPVPPPASAYLAIGMPILPVPREIDWEGVELSTPTGLAILKALAPEFQSEWPAGTVRAQGFGAGTLDFPTHPNVFRVVLMEGEETASFPGDLPYEAGTVVEIQCNVDDQTGERSGWLIKRVIALGALDAWMTPLVGKKGRPALCFTLLAHPSKAAHLADWLLRHSSTFGIRYSSRDKLKLVRSHEVRQTPGGPVRFTVGRTTEGELVKEKPEFDDLERIWEEDPDFLP